MSLLVSLYGQVCTNFIKQLYLKSWLLGNHYKYAVRNNTYWNFDIIVII